MFDISDLRPTIIPKSDQLNADQLLAGPMTIKVTEVTVSNSPEQPVSIHYEGEDGRPFKPCKTMRKVMLLAWGQDGRDWVGRSVTLYTDPSVKWAGAEVGGIRISHLSDIERQIQVSLAANKKSKVMHIINVLKVTVPSPVLMDDSTKADWLAHITSATNSGELKERIVAARAACNAIGDTTTLAAFTAAADEIVTKAKQKTQTKEENAKSE